MEKENCCCESLDLDRKPGDLTRANLKSFHLRLEEHNGERSYYYYYLIYAKNKRDALRIARGYASDFYGDTGKEIEKNRWEFFCGEIVVDIETLEEMSEAEYARLFFGCPHVLNPHGAKIPGRISVSA
jgi:hypothetical protein